MKTRKELLEMFGLPDCSNLVLRVDKETERVSAECYQNQDSTCSTECPSYRPSRFIYANRECYEE